MPRKWPMLLELSATLGSLIWFFYETGFEPAIVAVTSLGWFISLIKSDSSSTTQGYRAGYRLKRVRKQLGWTTSEATERLGLKSESLYRKMESGSEDVPLDAINQLCHITGINTDWLTHSDTRNEFHRWLWKYFSATSDWYGVRTPYLIREAQIHSRESVTDTIQEIIRANPQHIYIAVNPDQSVPVYLIVKRQEYYQVWDLHGLNFWCTGWGGDLKYLPYVYAFYKALIKVRRHRIIGLYLSEKQAQSLEQGQVYPGNIVRQSIRNQLKDKRKNTRYWPIDLIDIEYKDSPKEQYQEWYGEWFVRVQGYFSKYSAPQNSQEHR